MKFLARLEADTRSAGEDAHWAVFHERFVQPILTGSEPASMDALCTRHDIASAKTVANLAVTMKGGTRRDPRFSLESSNAFG
jgi:hypothetical protein